MFPKDRSSKSPLRRYSETTVARVQSSRVEFMVRSWIENVIVPTLVEKYLAERSLQSEDKGE
jgi:hypothetical protein